MRTTPPQISPEIEAWRERVRHLPGVVVHRTPIPVPFVPDIRVMNIKHIDELIGDDDELDDKHDAES